MLFKDSKFILHFSYWYNKRGYDEVIDIHAYIKEAEQHCKLINFPVEPVHYIVKNVVWIWLDS